MFVRLIGLFLFLCLIAVAVLVVPPWYLRQVSAPGPLESSMVFTIERGQSAKAIIDKLEAQGAINNEVLALISARLNSSTFKAGQFELPKSASLRDIFLILEDGKARSLAITIPEGLTVKQIIAKLNADDRLTGEIETLPAEGSLLPETYFIEAGATRQSILDRMSLELRKIFFAAWENRAADLPFKSPEQALTLASIVERETAVASERGVVASVYVNRLRKGMLLQADPTLVYYESEGVGKLGRGLTRAELRLDHPYNTYTRKGLPPGPIANVGKAAIQAVLNPDDTPYFFFVADGKGGHAFAVTYDEHKKNVAAWRKIEAQR